MRSPRDPQRRAGLASFLVMTMPSWSNDLRSLDDYAGKVMTDQSQEYFGPAPGETFLRLRPLLRRVLARR